MTHISLTNDRSTEPLRTVQIFLLRVCKFLLSDLVGMLSKTTTFSHLTKVHSIVYVGEWPWVGSRHNVGFLIYEENSKLYTIYTDNASLQKNQVANSYELFGILDSHDKEVSDDEEGEKQDVWFQNVAIDEVGEYYMHRPSEGLVVCMKCEISNNIWDDNGIG